MIICGHNADQAARLMNWLLKKLGYREREYSGDGFSVRIEQVQREVVSVSYTRNATRLNLDGERIGSKWEGIAVYFPPELAVNQTTSVVADLATALQALGYGYVIARLAEIEVVPETERQKAIAELNAMGFDIEVSPDLKQIRQKRRPGAPRSDLQTLREQGPRMTALLEAVRGRRQRLEILAKSRDLRSPFRNSPKARRHHDINVLCRSYGCCRSRK